MATTITSATRQLRWQPQHQQQQLTTNCATDRSNKKDTPFCNSNNGANKFNNRSRDQTTENQTTDETDNSTNNRDADKVDDLDNGDEMIATAIDNNNSSTESSAEVQRSSRISDRQADAARNNDDHALNRCPNESTATEAARDDEHNDNDESTVATADEMLSSSLNQSQSADRQLNRSPNELQALLNSIESDQERTGKSDCTSPSVRGHNHIAVHDAAPKIHEHNDNEQPFGQSVLSEATANPESYPYHVPSSTVGAVYSGGVIARPICTSQPSLQSVIDYDNKQQRRESSIMCDELAQCSDQSGMEFCRNDELGRYCTCASVNNRQQHNGSHKDGNGNVNPSAHRIPESHPVTSQETHRSVRFCTTASQSTAMECEQIRVNYFVPDQRNDCLRQGDTECTSMDTDSTDAVDVNGNQQRWHSESTIRHPQHHQQQQQQHVISHLNDTNQAAPCTYNNMNSTEHYYSALMDVPQQPQQQLQYSSYHYHEKEQHRYTSLAEPSHIIQSDHLVGEVQVNEQSAYSENANEPNKQKSPTQIAVNERHPRRQLSGDEPESKSHPTTSNLAYHNDTNIDLKQQQQQAGLVYLMAEVPDHTPQAPANAFEATSNQVIGYKAQEYCYQQQPPTYVTSAANGSPYTGQQHDLTGSSTAIVTGAAAAINQTINDDMRCYTNSTSTGSNANSISPTNEYAVTRLNDNSHLADGSCLVAESDGKTFHVIENTRNTHISDPMQLLTQQNDNMIFQQQQQQPYVVMPTDTTSDSVEYYRAPEWSSSSQQLRHLAAPHLYNNSSSSNNYYAMDTAQDDQVETKLPRVEGYYDPNAELIDHLNNRYEDDDEDNEDEEVDSARDSDQEIDDEASSSGASYSRASERVPASRSTAKNNQSRRTMTGGSYAHGASGLPGCKPDTLRRLKELLERRHQHRRSNMSRGSSTQSPASQFGLQQRRGQLTRRYNNNYTQSVLSSSSKDRSDLTVAPKAPESGRYQRTRSGSQIGRASASNGTNIANNNGNSNPKASTLMRQYGSASSSPMSTSTLSSPPETPASSLFANGPTSLLSSRKLLDSDQTPVSGNAEHKQTSSKRSRESKSSDYCQDGRHNDNNISTDLLSDCKQLRNRKVVPATSIVRHNSRRYSRPQQPHVTDRPARQTPDQDEEVDERAVDNVDSSIINHDGIQTRGFKRRRQLYGSQSSSEETTVSN